MDVQRILVVCTGNSCRSVMAQRLLARLFERGGIPVQVESAGLFAMPGMPPTKETEQVLRRVGLDCSDHRARIVTPEAVDAADLILVMEPFHHEEIFRRFPPAAGKTHLLNAYGRATMPPGEPLGIHDPIGKPLEVYEVCFGMIRDAAERVARALGVSLL